METRAIAPGPGQEWRLQRLELGNGCRTPRAAPTRIEAGHVKDSPILLERAPLKERIASLMATGALDTKTVAERLGVTTDVARSTLERHAGPGKAWLRLPNTQPILYGLPSYARV
jgi:hypothetical protein